MASQKAWDRYEASILLEALIQVRDGTVSRREAIVTVSKNYVKKLRQKALK